ncbi:hypothetical protein M501DRAFT_999297 [Patellaria atrata CBS 101060]|uniref:Uncharacterized protein n=1 Tax=Patellaria atrata CBS 101060 TaxID=1346257 RepID=A0A9P4S590_9PEZI|nr:hypothetical protein M501DRAFT_999297 [Patellaria atrata CBS 101060]
MVIRLSGSRSSRVAALCSARYTCFFIATAVGCKGIIGESEDYPHVDSLIILRIPWWKMPGQNGKSTTDN